MKRILAFTSLAANALRRLNRAIIIAVVVPFMLVAPVSPAFTQSKSRDNPTPLTSPEISKYLDRKSNSESAGNDYYSFSAGPGEVVITLNVLGDSKTLTYVSFTLFDEDARAITGETVGSSGEEEKGIKRFTLSKKQTILLRISVISPYTTAGKYRIQLSGAIDLGEGKSTSGGSLECLPKQGTLVVKMRDGSTSKIDLSKAQEMTIEH